jgi:valyl-tRNA synthetase
LWNIARFVLTETEGKTEGTSPTLADQEIVKRLDEVVSEVTDDLEHFRYHLAGEKLYHYVWHEFADKILEESKPILSGDDAHAKASRRDTLSVILDTSLRLLHPFMPFVTEEIWQHLPRKDADLLMVAPWPKC